MRALVLSADHALTKLLKDRLSALGVLLAVHAKPKVLPLDPAQPAPAIAIVDWPGSMEGLRERCRSLRASPGAEHLLILGLAPKLTPHAECRALEAGCDDVLASPPDAPLLALRLKRLLERAVEGLARRLAEQAVAGRDANGAAGPAPRSDAAGRLLNALLSSSMGAVFVMRAVRTPGGEISDFVFDEVNGEAERMVGLSRAVLIGRKATEAIPGFRSNTLFRQGVQALESGRSLEQEMPLDPAAPSPRWFRYQIVPHDEGATVLAREITGRKTMERDLQRAGERLRTLMDAIPHGLFMKDELGRMVAVNRTMADWIKVPADALLGRTETELDSTTPGQNNKIHATDREVLETGRTLEFEFRRVPEADGSGEYLQILKRPIKDAQGRIVGLVGFAQDITARKRREEEFQRSKALLQAVFDAIPHAVFVKDPQDRYVAVNRAMELLQGPGSGTLIGQNILAGESRDAPDFDLARITTREIIEGADRVDFSQVLTLPHLGRREFRTIKVPLRDEQGRVTGVVAISEDITDRVKAERERRAGEVMLQAVFDAIPHFVWVKDRDGRYIKVNRAGDDMAEPGKSLIGRRAVVEEGRPIEELDQVDAENKRVLAGERLSVIGKITRPDGSVREMHKIKVPLRDPDGRVAGIVGVSEDITDRLQSERKLRESQALLQAVFDAIPYTVYAKDTASKFIAVNKATELQWQQPAEVLLTQRFGNDPMRPESERAQILRQDRRVLETGERYEEPVRFNVPGKGLRDFRNIKVPMRDGDGRITGLVGVSEDITERVTAERELRESRALLQSILDTLPETVYVKDRDFRYTMVNSVMCSRLNLSRKDLLGKTADSLRTMSPATLPLIHDADRHVLATGEVVELPDMRFVFPGGRVMHERQLKAPLRDSSGEIIGIVGMAEDTTARVQADEALKSNQRLLRTILDTLPEGVFVKDLAGRYQLVNKHHAELYGLDPQEFLGRRTAELKIKLEPERLALIEASDRTVMEEGKMFEIAETPYANSAGEASWERVVKVPLRDDHGQIAGIVGLREDITSRKKAESERLALERLMQRTQNLESLGAMAGGIAHDFNNLLQRILGYAELALLEVEAGSAAAASVQMIQDAGVSAAGLTKQMLTLSGRSRFALEPVDLDALAESSAVELRRTLAPGLELNFLRGTDSPRIMGDSALLRQVLHSLVSNGEEALAGMPGRIALTTGAVTLARDRLDESYSDRDVAPGLYGYLDVSDSGPGIPADVRARLFEPFMSTKFMGRGLGLAAVRGIVRGHRGTIQVLSSAQTGTTFRILLPASDGRATPPSPGAKPGS